jgi:hypothetical protein
MDQFLDGSFLLEGTPSICLNEYQKQWISELQSLIDSEISLQLSCDDFKSFFSAKQEQTASSPSGRHMGHYRTLLDCIRKNNPNLPQLLNLYLYIPPLFAHPPSCFKGLIYGELKCYWTQNKPVDFIDILTKFITRLCDRGHKIETLAPLISQVAATLNRQHITTRTVKSDNQDTLYIHWPVHPHGIQRHTIRQLFNTILQPYIPFSRMQIAMSRPKNLKDVLTWAALTLPDDLSLPIMLAQANKTT